MPGPMRNKSLKSWTKVEPPFILTAVALSMNFADVLTLGAKYTVARMMGRMILISDIKEGLPIGVHDSLSLMQGYDSVVLEADIELGGTDQLTFW